MNTRKLLEGIGRPVAYYPGLNRITGSAKATLLLCQLIYWIGKETHDNGWIYKSEAEFEIETGLSRKEQINARKKLRKLGLINEHYKRFEHHLYFQVNIDNLLAKWSEACA